MSEAPERLLLELRQGMTFDAWSECRDPRYARSEPVEYIRADLSDALLREAMDALICVIPTHRFVGNFCWCPAARDADAGHTADCLKARATLAKLRAHLGEKK